jgi:hypothetical protein
LFSCILALAAKSYTIHLVIEEQNGTIKVSTKAAIFYTKAII